MEANGYQLADDQVIRRVLPPFPFQREEIICSLPVPDGKAPVGEPTALLLEWGCGDLRVRMSCHYSNGLLLRDLADHALHNDYWDWEGDRPLLLKPVGGDAVIRTGALQQQYLRDLEKVALELWPGERITMVARLVRREVWVFSGSWRFTPIDSLAEAGQRIELYHRELDTDRERPTSATGDVMSFAKTVGRYAGAPVVFEPTGAPDHIAWHSHAMYDMKQSARRLPFDQSLILRHIEQQTGLTATRQFRTVQRFFIEAIDGSPPAKAC